MDKDTWNRFILENGGDFLQSYEWGEFQRSLGRRVERIYTNEFLAQVFFRPLGFGYQAGYVPRGPIKISDSIREDLFWSEFAKIRDSHTIFFEFDLLNRISFLEPTSRQTRQPRLTNMLDLERDENKIFARVHKNHRYSVRKAQEQGIYVKRQDDWEGFYRLVSRTARSRHFRIWPRDYYEKLYATLAPAGLAEIRSAYEGKKLVGAHLYILFGGPASPGASQGGRATHLFGGSDHSASVGSVVPLLHWEAIGEFKRRGFKEYDFWGIEPKLPRSLVRFKERFGGARVEYPGSYVKVLRSGWYRAYKLARIVK